MVFLGESENPHVSMLCKDPDYFDYQNEHARDNGGLDLADDEIISSLPLTFDPQGKPNEVLKKGQQTAKIRLSKTKGPTFVANEIEESHLKPPRQTRCEEPLPFFP